MCGFRYRLDACDLLLDLGFLVHHVLTYDWVVLFHLHFSWSILFVFIRGVEMTCTFGRYKADFIS